eukprot:TRINITY_DN5143_c0_g1_i6.p1 TRINITY_DN5143_c0_g1~~TRINITY_DN5143_c0_g1_i6.p1  ORF type:complete len:307 (+),score=46.60 TRINITY_DN5143_c0_g1_i6:323-1243(+)
MALSILFLLSTLFCFAHSLGTAFTDDLKTFNSQRWEISTYPTSDLFASQWETSQVSFDSSKGMTLIIDQVGCPASCGQKNWRAGEYTTKEVYGYGYFEARFIPACSKGGISSMFTYFDDPNGAEIDIEFEGDSGDCQKVSYTHYAGGQTYGWGRFDLGFNASEGFHSYGFLWTDKNITWYVDRKVHFTSDSTAVTPNSNMNMLMNNWVVSNQNGYYGKFPLNTVVNATYEYAAYFPLDQLPSDLGKGISASSSSSTGTVSSGSSSSVSTTVAGGNPSRSGEGQYFSPNAILISLCMLICKYILNYT